MEGIIEVIAEDYPGHGRRNKEAFCSSIRELAVDAASLIRNSLRDGEPYALMGYSMGSIVVYELLRMLPNEKRPAHVFLGAHEPKSHTEFMKLSDEGKEERIKKAITLFGGVPQKLMDNPTFWRIYMPVYQSDFQMIWSYDFDGMTDSSDIPATVLYSDTDTPTGDIRLWDHFFTGQNIYHCFEGNHFFLREHQDEIAEIINWTLSGKT